VITTAQALSGPWALNARGWLWAIVPTVGVIVAQEFATPFPSPVWVYASAALQMVAVVAWSIVVVALSRARTGRVVPLASGLLWVGGGVVHGVVGGGLALAAGAPAEWGYRIGFWVVASATWMPLLTYALAKWDERRRLLAERDALDDEIELATERAAEDADVRIARFAGAIDNAFTPALEEIRAQLRENGARIDAATAQSIAGRLDELAARSAAFTAVEPVVADVRPPRRVSVAAASVDFELDRPVTAALLVAALTAPPLLPEAYRSGGWGDAAEMGVAILVAVGVLTGSFAVLRPRWFDGPARSLLSRIAVVVAGLAGGLSLLLLDWHVDRPVQLVLILLVPVLVAIAASMTSVAVALHETNAELAAHARADRKALADLAERIRLVDELSTARLTTLLRGEVNGKLAACAMALAFLSNGAPDDATRADIVAKVLSQLDAAAEELRTR